MKRYTSTPVFSTPQRKNINLTRPMWVSGKGLPKGGICIPEGSRVMIMTENGSDWFLCWSYNRKPITIAVNPRTL